MPAVDTRDQWYLSCTWSADGSWRGRLIQRSEYGAVIDVDHLHDDWTITDYEHRRDADWEAVWKYGSPEALREAAVRQWKRIGYLSWGTGAVLRIDGQVTAEVGGKSCSRP